MSGRKWLVAAVTVATTGMAAVAHAQDAGVSTPNCNDPKYVNPIYFAGSSAFEPTVKALGLKLAAQTGDNQATLIYKGTASCDGTNAIKGNTDLTGTANAYTMVPDPNDSTKMIPGLEVCAFPAGIKADVGVSDVFYGTCPDIGARPATIADIAGPVQPMLFIVPKANTTTTNITAEEAQLIWGCGMKGMVSPFDDPAGIMQRSSASGTQNVIAKHINVPAAAFLGVSNTSGGDLVNSLLAAPNPQKAIGFLAADAYATRTDRLTSVAFRGFDQKKAYYADSDANAVDRRNVRDGHYLPWGPEHLIVRLGSDGNPSATATKAIGWINGTLANPGFDYVAVEAKAGVIPQCAMRVQRGSDGGYLSPYTPADPCGCFFEASATGVATPPGCTACTDDAGCSGGKTCHHNFCE